ncbi:MAG: methylenetetrahydrofolate--tRNA-(uracil(54)-C(5))-methyltransferase (FADH(2)-oxidizing) TrmFO [Gemmatimonadota bacterium]|nr:methylenetetrahydrofolate--tRNA-(uracil(54)-C(5))-methyltransferase (FADH(2)-oxidizing) TrmFO [Gemmatimonadota bacterium]
MTRSVVSVVGGGLAGSEAAWQLAESGYEVRLFEMRPEQRTPAHETGDLAEVVCTNSFKSEALDTSHGILKAEMRGLGCMLLTVADECRVPAGSALAVDRRRFSAEVTRRVLGHPRIRLFQEEVRSIPEGPTIIATGPLTSDALSDSIRSLLGDDSLAFFDAIAPIVARDSIDEDVTYVASRYDKGGADYVNCPLDRKAYEAFIDALLAADIHQGHDWDQVPYFEGCLPIEVMAGRGRETLRHGPMRPVGLLDPRSGRQHYAVVQLRMEDRAGQMWNLVGCQTRMKVGEQLKVFRMIPGLEQAEFLRFGSIHRNSYLNFPARLTPHGAVNGRGDLLFAGQLTGVEGYTESIASGLMAALNLDRILRLEPPVIPPPTTMIGGLYRYLREADPTQFQPMNVNFGLLDPLPGNTKLRRKHRRAALGARALEQMEGWCTEYAPRVRMT